jgi:hypothetical protein
MSSLALNLLHSVTQANVHLAQPITEGLPFCSRFVLQTKDRVLTCQCSSLDRLVCYAAFCISRLTRIDTPYASLRFGGVVFAITNRANLRPFWLICSAISSWLDLLYCSVFDLTRPKAHGGSIAANAILGAAPAQLVSPYPLMIYSTVHVAVMLACHFFPSTFQLFPLLDLPFALVDAFSRSSSIVSVMAIAHKHPTAEVSNSSFAQAVLGAIATNGGGQIAATISAWEDEWRLTTPPFLRTLHPLTTLDIWSAALGTFVYGALTAISPSHALFYQSFAGKSKFLLKPDGARAVVVLLLASLFILRLLLTQAGRLTTKAPSMQVNQRELQARRDAKRKVQ